MTGVKRILCVMLAALLVICMIPATAFAGMNEYCPECHESYTHAYCVECRKCNFCIELCDVCEELCEECCDCAGVTITGTIFGHFANKEAIVKLVPESDMPEQICTVKVGTDSYSFTKIPAGKYTIMVIQSDIKIAERSITVSSKNVTLNFSCTRPPCPSCGKVPVGVVCSGCMDCSDCAVLCPSHALCNSCSVYLGVHCASCTKCGNESEICADCGFCSECAVLKGKHCPECREHYTHAYCVECKKCNSCVELCEVCEELCEECCVCIKVTIKGTIAGHDVSKDVIIRLEAKAGTPAQSVTVKAGTDSYSFTEIPSGEYTITVIQSDVTLAQRTVTVGEKNITLDFECTPRPVCPSCMKEPEGELCADCGYCSECAVLKGKHCPECREHHTHAYCVECKKCNSCVELCEVCEELCEDCCVCDTGVYVKGVLKGSDPAKEHKIFMYPDDPNKDTRQYELLEGRYVFQFVGVHSGGYTIEVHQGGEKIAEVHIQVGIKNVEVEIVMSETEEYLLGDVNGDGKINALDATQILRYANNKSSVIAAMSDAEAKGKADVNKDGKINALDATQILRYANNKSSILK